MAAPEDFGDRQWLQALAAVLIGLWLAGGAAHRSGPVEVLHPLRAVGAALGEAGCRLIGREMREMATIMSGRHGNQVNGHG